MGITVDKMRLKIRLGEREFEAEGATLDVQARWEEAKKWLFSETSYIDLKKQGEKGDFSPPSPPLINHPLFEINRAQGGLRLRILPPRGEVLERISQGLLLLLYGYQSLLNKQPVEVTRLADDLRLSGFASLHRLSRAFGKLEQHGFSVRTGRGKGTKYQATSPGLKEAEVIIEALGRI